MAHLDEQKRWWRVTVKDVEQAEYTHFSWILPSEFVGDTVFARHGGFAYVNRRQRKAAAVPGVFYPVVSAEEQRQQAEEERWRRSNGENGREAIGRNRGGKEQTRGVGGKGRSGRDGSGGDLQHRGVRDYIPVIREREIDVTVILRPQEETRVQWPGGGVCVCTRGRVCAHACVFVCSRG